jgi:uncharacterized protein YvpB
MATGRPCLLEDRETTGIRTADKTHRLTGIGFQVWMTLARLNVGDKKQAPRGASLQQLANRLEADKKVVSWQTAYDTARWYVWKFKKLGIVKEVDTDAPIR